MCLFYEPSGRYCVFSLPRRTFDLALAVAKKGWKAKDKELPMCRFSWLPESYYVDINKIKLNILQNRENTEEFLERGAGKI